MDNKDIIGIVGAGLIGRAWTCVFARAGHQVQLWDPDPTLRAQMPELLRAMLLEAGDDPRRPPASPPATAWSRR